MKTITNISALLLWAICVLSFQSCNSNNSEQLSDRMNQAKSKFLDFEKLSNKEKIANEHLLSESIELLENILLREANNAEANYYYGCALDLQLNNSVDILNFEIINLQKTKRISLPFEKSILDTNYLPAAQRSQYTNISNIWTKLALNYIVKGQPDSAKFAFIEGNKRGGFTPANQEYALNLLNSLESNSILFVNTSIEANELWYQQFVKNIRPDVSIVNLSLLDYQWYSKWLNFPTNFTNTIITNLDDNTLGAAYSSANSPIIDTIIEIESKKSKLFKDQNSNIQITLSGRGRNEHGVILPIADRISLAIIITNIWDRPIYFSINTSKHLPYSLGLAEYIKLEGLAAKLYPNRIMLKESVNGDKIARLLFENFNFNELNNSTSLKDRDLQYIAANYRFLFLQTMYYYNEFGNNSNMLIKLYDLFEKCFPKFYYPRTNEELSIFKNIKSQNSELNDK